LYKFWFRTGTSGFLFERGYGISHTVKAKNFTASWRPIRFYEGLFSCWICCNSTFNKKSGLWCPC